MSNCCTTKKCKCLKFQSSYNFNTPLLGTVFTTLVGKINDYVPCVKMLAKEPNGYAPVLQIEKALNDGRLDCAFTGLNYSFLLNTFYELYSTVPFGMTSTAFVSYLFEEGAIEKLNKEAEKHNLFFYPMCLVPPELGGWFNKEIKHPSDFSDIKMRLYGIGRNVIEALGGSTVFLP